MINELENDIPFMSCAPVIVRSSCTQGETAQARTGRALLQPQELRLIQAPPGLEKTSLTNSLPTKLIE